MPADALTVFFQANKYRMHYACPDCKAGLDDVGDLAGGWKESHLAFRFAGVCYFCGTTEGAHERIEAVLTNRDHAHPWDKEAICVWSED